MEQVIKIAASELRTMAAITDEVRWLIALGRSPFC